jgi:hypothetical protein
MRKPNRKTVRDAIRASVPDGKLKGAKIVLADRPEQTGQIGGFTQYDEKNRRDVVKLGAPIGDNAKGVTIRGHETRHATRHTPRRKKPLTENEAIAAQIVDDVNIESTMLPSTATPGMMRIYQRAHLATAMDGVRTLKKNVRAVRTGKAKDSPELRNGQLLNAVRTVAMLKHYGTGADIKSEFTARRGRRHVRHLMGDKLSRAIATVVNLAKVRSRRARAISVLVALLESPEQEWQDEEPTGRKPGDILPPVEAGDALDGKMELRDLRPKTVSCDKQKSINRRFAPNGSIINPLRFLAAVINGDSNGLFRQRIRNKPGGCVVIDASGSMGASRANLSALCALVPTATVGYYSGHSNGRGVLAIYASNGKRFAGELPCDTLLGGNAVDLPAVKWLMSHSKPWTLVSDLEFCGGVLGSEIVAHAIVERATNRGDLTVHRSLDAAFEAFGGKGNLPE